jgi:hypothetical protein
MAISQTGTSYTFTSALPGQTLIHWQVRAKSAVGAGAWTYSNFHTPVATTGSTYSLIDIYAGGIPNGGIYPSMTLNLNNSSNLKTWLNVAGDPSNRVFTKYSYIYPAKLTNGQSIYIKYIGSSTYPAPLIVDRIVVDGKTYQSEASTVYGVGVINYTIQPSCYTGYGKTETLRCTGYLKFTLTNQ